MSKISSRDLELLPDIDGLKALLQSLATLDAIIEPWWESRIYSFNSNWGTDAQLGSMRNGQGDEFFAIFNPLGFFFKGFVHDSAMALQPPEIWPGLLETVPKEFESALCEPAFSMSDVTFCFWRRYGDANWTRGNIEFPEGNDPDGSSFLLELLDCEPASYCNFASSYFGVAVPFEVAKSIYKHMPLTESLVKSLNSDIELIDLEEDLNEIGYPVANTT